MPFINPETCNKNFQISCALLVTARSGQMPGVGQMHLEVPWESLFGLKMKIYVEIPHSEKF